MFGVIELGGTKTLFGIFDETGQLLNKFEKTTETPEEFITQTE